MCSQGVQVETAEFGQKLCGNPCATTLCIHKDEINEVAGRYHAERVFPFRSAVHEEVAMVVHERRAFWAFSPLINDLHVDGCQFAEVRLEMLLDNHAGRHASSRQQSVGALSVRAARAQRGTQHSKIV